MNMQQMPLLFTERVSFELRSLYNRYGYSQYKMSKFEEYDLYARNKDFLISDRVITFMDTNGKLMALKPDVTLSIVKNSKDLPSTVQKLYYHENVYRVAKGTQGFKELMQVGLECLGNIDDYCISEVLLLAVESLRSISEDSVLDISHLGLLSELIDALGIPHSSKAEVLRCIGQKNLHELTALCRSLELPENSVDVLRQVVSTAGAPEAVLPPLRELLTGIVDIRPLEQLLRVTEVIEDPAVRRLLRIDFSVVDDIHYYNGIVFKGFVAGLPESVLSGGQYDNLMRRLKRKAGAIGFAVYTDLLERLEKTTNDSDVDAVLLYDETTPLMAIKTQMDLLMKRGSSVLAQQCLPENITCRQILDLRSGEVKLLENHA
jgi:ATP phosphoribosyltransferase regulatory subunit